MVTAATMVTDTATIPGAVGAGDSELASIPGTEATMGILAIRTRTMDVRRTPIRAMDMLPADMLLGDTLPVDMLPAVMPRADMRRLRRITLPS